MNYEAIWIQRFEANKCTLKKIHIYVALIPDYGEEEIIASFKNYNDAVAFGETKARELGLLLVNFLRENTQKRCVNG